MLFRKFGKLDWDVSILGFGCLRLPVKNVNAAIGQVDEPSVIRMIRHAVDNGINYFDTAYTYHNGESEVALGKALKDGYGRNVRIATKSPVWLLKKKSDFDRYLDEQLKRLKMEHIDFYLFHGLNKYIWENIMMNVDFFSRVEAAMKDGRIGSIGFSFHGDFECFRKIVDAYDKWGFCYIQYNYVDTESQAGAMGLRYASSKGLAVVVMEPLLGGKLALPPNEVKKIFDSHETKREPADWAFKWLWNQPEVTAVLSGMRIMNQVDKNIASACGSETDRLSADEIKFLAKARKIFLNLTAISCNECNYCTPCPAGINIPQIFHIYNKAHMYGKMKIAQIMYRAFLNASVRPENCTGCKSCEKKCPQGIPVSGWMSKIGDEFGQDEKFSTIKFQEKKHD